METITPLPVLFTVTELSSHPCQICSWRMACKSNLHKILYFRAGLRISVYFPLPSSPPILQVWDSWQRLESSQMEGTDGWFLLLELQDLTFILKLWTCSLTQTGFHSLGMFLESVPLWDPVCGSSCSFELTLTFPASRHNLLYEPCWRSVPISFILLSCASLASVPTDSSDNCHV